MAKKQTALAVVEPEAPRETLHLIETQLRELIEFRDGLGDEELEAIKATDAQIQEYVGREIRKVTAIAAILRWFKSQAAAAEAEEVHARKWAARWMGRYNRLATMVHGVMVASDLPKLEGATDRFRRQQNPEALEIVDLVALPDEYFKTTVRMPKVVWDAIALAVKADELAQMTITNDVDAPKVKAALQAMVDCGPCKGVGEVASGDGKHVLVCEKCQGAGQVRWTVKGAKLSRGEHLRVE